MCLAASGFHDPLDNKDNENFSLHSAPARANISQPFVIHRLGKVKIEPCIARAFLVPLMNPPFIATIEIPEPVGRIRISRANSNSSIWGSDIVTA
jgi:hypothetical protein